MFGTIADSQYNTKIFSKSTEHSRQLTKCLASAYKTLRFSKAKAWKTEKLVRVSNGAE